MAKTTPTMAAQRQVKAIRKKAPKVAKKAVSTLDDQLSSVESAIEKADSIIEKADSARKHQPVQSAFIAFGALTLVVVVLLGLRRLRSS